MDFIASSFISVGWSLNQWQDVRIQKNLVAWVVDFVDLENAHLGIPDVFSVIQEIEAPFETGPALGSAHGLYLRPPPLLDLGSMRRALREMGVLGIWDSMTDGLHGASK